MRLKSAHTRLEGEQEPITPLAGFHRGGLTREVSGELLIQGDDDRLLAWEISVQQTHADMCVFGDLAQRRGLIAPLADHPNRSLVKTVSGRRALRRLTWRAATFSALDIISEHVH